MNVKLPPIKSPVNLDSNGTIYFKVPTGTYTTETATGNKIPDYTETAVDVLLTEIGDRFFGDSDAGLNSTERRVRGYFLTSSLPAGFRASDRAKIIMKTSTGTEEAELRFTERYTPLKDTVIAGVGIPFEGFSKVIGGGF